MPSNLSTRINAIQKTLGVAETGVFDIDTCTAIIQRAGQIAASNSLVTLIKMVQRIINADADGVVGPQTITKVEAFLSPALPKPPAGGSLVVSQKSLDLIVFFEVTSKEVFDKNYQNCNWPGGASGVSLGIGYDCGYYTRAQIAIDWSPYLSAGDIQILQSVAGKTGEAAKAALPSAKSVKVNFDKAIKVFYHSNLPDFGKRTKKTFPGIEKLPPDAQGALLSLVYNRGTALQGDSRKEMKAIVPLVAAGNLAGIATQFRNMKRLWPKFKGLRDRREREAVLVENASFHILPENLVII